MTRAIDDVIGTHSVTYTEYPANGKIKMLIVDGTHWVTVAEANLQEGVGRADERERVLADLRERVQALEAWVPKDGRDIIRMADVLDLIDTGGPQ